MIIHPTYWLYDAQAIIGRLLFIYAFSINGQLRSMKVDEAIVGTYLSKRCIWHFHAVCSLEKGLREVEKLS